MNISEFIEICEQFFDTMNPNYCEDYIDENYDSETMNEFWIALEDFFNQINPPPHLLLNDN
jgi:hypothetical protein